MRAKLLVEGRGFQIATLGSLVVTTHLEAATGEFLVRFGDVLREHRTVWPRYSTLAIVSGSGIKQPEAGLKEHVIALEKNIEKSIIASAVVIEAKGLAAVFTRGFLVAYTLLSSHQFPFQSFGRIEDGVSWLQSLAEQESGFRGDSGAAAAARQALNHALGADEPAQRF